MPKNSVLMPDSFFGSIYEITPGFLAEHGIKAIVSDIDNTLVTYDDPEPTEKLREWFGLMEEAGIRIAFISNNHGARVEKFNESLGFPAFPKARKPFTRQMKRAVDALGEGYGHTASLGDQLLTDVAAGNRSGLFTILVPPINDKRNLFFRTKRMIERKYIKKYLREHPEANVDYERTIWAERKQRGIL